MFWSDKAWGGEEKLCTNLGIALWLEAVHLPRGQCMRPEFVHTSYAMTYVLFFF